MFNELNHIKKEAKSQKEYIVDCAIIKYLQENDYTYSDLIGRSRVIISRATGEEIYIHDGNEIISIKYKNELKSFPSNMMGE